MDMAYVNAEDIREKVAECRIRLTTLQESMEARKRAKCMRIVRGEECVTM
ncbi:MAG: hypothetical protein ACLRMN_02525 [Mediterraneibacter gnavus]